MGNISKEERARRAAEAGASNAPEENNEVTETVTTDPVEDVIKDATPYEPAEREMREVIIREMDAERKLSLDAIEEAAKRAAAVAAEKVRGSNLAKELRADPTNLRKRKDFLTQFGTGKNRPARPIPGPMGHKDDKCLEWDAAYEPEEFVKRWENSKAPIIIRLRNEALARIEKR